MLTEQDKQDLKAIAEKFDSFFKSISDKNSFLIRVEDFVRQWKDLDDENQINFRFNLISYLQVSIGEAALLVVVHNEFLEEQLRLLDDSFPDDLYQAVLTALISSFEKTSVYLPKRTWLIDKAWENTSRSLSQHFEAERINNERRALENTVTPLESYPHSSTNSVDNRDDSNETIDSRNEYNEHIIPLDIKIHIDTYIVEYGNKKTITFNGKKQKKFIKNLSWNKLKASAEDAVETMTDLQSKKALKAMHRNDYDSICKRIKNILGPENGRRLIELMIDSDAPDGFALTNNTKVYYNGRVITEIPSDL